MMVVSDISAPPTEVSTAAAPGFAPGVSVGENLTLLRAAFAQDEANHGTFRYPIDADGLVRVPLEAVGPLIWNGGFAVPKTAGHMFSLGFVKLHHSDASGCSYSGEGYSSDEKGDVLVPAEAAFELLAHGFVPVLQSPTSTSTRTRPVPVNRSVKG